MELKYGLCLRKVDMNVCEKAEISVFCVSIRHATCHEWTFRLPACHSMNFCLYIMN